MPCVPRRVRNPAVIWLVRMLVMPRSLTKLTSRIMKSKADCFDPMRTHAETASRMRWFGLKLSIVSRARFR